VAGHYSSGIVRAWTEPLRDRERVLPAVLARPDPARPDLRQLILSNLILRGLEIRFSKDCAPANEPASEVHLRAEPGERSALQSEPIPRMSEEAFQDAPAERQFAWCCVMNESSDSCEFPVTASAPSPPTHSSNDSADCLTHAWMKMKWPLSPAARRRELQQGAARCQAKGL